MVSFTSQAIESVLAQPFGDWEVIIVDDCFSGDSLSIVQKYVRVDPRIRYLQTDKPSGSPMSPRNMKVKEAKGRYIAFLDSDDIWLPSKLSDQLKVSKESEVATVFSSYEEVGLGGEQCGREIITPCEADYPLLLKGNHIGCLTAMHGSALTGKVSFKEIRHEDYACRLSILEQGYRAQDTNTVMALYRVNDHPTSSNKLRAICWQWNILKNEMDLSAYGAVYYFIHYAIRAFVKAMG